MDEVFDALKLSPGEKKMLRYLMKHEQGTSLEIQKEASIQQPEVSMAVKALIKRKYVKSELITLTTKSNRQMMVYSLTKDVYKLMAEDLNAVVTDLLSKSDFYASLIEELVAMKNNKEKTE